MKLFFCFHRWKTFISEKPWISLKVKKDIGDEEMHLQPFACTKCKKVKWKYLGGNL